MKELIFDATPLIYLGKLKILEEIQILRTKNIICKSIYNEVVEEGKKRGFEEANYIKKLVDKGLFQIVEVNNLIKSIQENPNLKYADIEILSFAKRNNSTVVADDEEVRKVARTEDVEYVGSIFILFKLLKHKRISKKELRNLLDKMINLGWRCSTELYALILEELERYKI